MEGWSTCEASRWAFATEATTSFDHYSTQAEWIDSYSPIYEEPLIGSS